MSIHLDEIRNATDAKQIIDSIDKLSLDTQKTIMLFASSQMLVDTPYWKQFVKKLIEKRMLRFIAVDKI